MPKLAATDRTSGRRGHRTLCPATRHALALRRRIRALGARDLLLPALITLLVLATALFPQVPLRDAATHGEVQGMHLAISRNLAIIAPLASLLDMQALLTVPQHIALVATLLLGFALWRGVAFARSTTWPIWRYELGRLVLLLALLVLVLLVNVLVPRPMARLVVEDPEVVVVDVHAHTASSHDGRPDWTPARVRDWHARSGFHVAYITDHKRFGGALDGVATNAARAGDGVVLLSGLELRSGGQHVNVLSMTIGDTVHLVEGDHLTRSMRLADGRTPVIVQTIPFDLALFAGSGQDTLPRTTALEINDGAPKGLTTGLTRHAELLQLAESQNLALVAGSDNHGWGNTATGWTLVRVPGWRELTPGDLAVRLEQVLATGRRATQVVERRTPLLVTAPQAALTVPVMLLTVTRALTPPERVSWVMWAWSTLLVRIGTRWAAQGSLARARLARRRHRLRIRLVPIGTTAGMQG